jgi:hypothetical protein
MLAGYFSRVMGSLLLRRTQEVMQYLQRHQDLLPRLVHHCDTTSVAEVLVRLVGADEQRTFLPTNHLQWLSGGGGWAPASCGWLGGAVGRMHGWWRGKGCSDCWTCGRRSECSRACGEWQVALEAACCAAQLV